MTVSKGKGTVRVLDQTRQPTLRSLPAKAPTWLGFGTAPFGRRQVLLISARGATRKPFTHEVADVAADERATSLVSRRYVGRVVHGDRVLISELCGAAEQSCRRRYDPTVARDPIDCFQQHSDTPELAPASNCHVRYLVTGKIERGERHIGIGKKRLGWFV